MLTGKLPVHRRDVDGARAADRAVAAAGAVVDQPVAFRASSIRSSPRRWRRASISATRSAATHRRRACGRSAPSSTCGPDDRCQRARVGRAARPAGTDDVRRSTALALLLGALAAIGWWKRDDLDARMWRRHARSGAGAGDRRDCRSKLARRRRVADVCSPTASRKILITRLGQTPGVSVLGRSATRGYPRPPARAMSPAELGASVVLTGSLRPSPDAIQVSLELIDPMDGAVIWSSRVHP